MGVPSAARMPPWVLRMRNSLPPTAAGSQPMPAFWVQPKRSPEGRLRSISGVMGSDPWGPGDLERTSKRVGSWESRISERVMVSGLRSPQRRGDADEALRRRREAGYGGLRHPGELHSPGQAGGPPY